LFGHVQRMENVSRAGLGKHYTGYQLKRGNEEDQGLHRERHNSEGHQPDECDVD